MAGSTWDSIKDFGTSLGEGLKGVGGAAWDGAIGLGKAAAEAADPFLPLSGNARLAAGKDLAQSEYDFTSTVFPSDIGMDYQGHYMVININVPTKAKRVFAKKAGLQLQDAVGDFTNYFTTIDQVSKVDTLRYGGVSVGGTQRAFFSIPRFTRRIAESIALFMPTPLIFNTNNIYEDISLTALGGKLGVAAAGAAGSVIAGYYSFLNAAKAGAATRTVADAAGKAFATASSIAQRPINPSVEVLFSNVAQRQFTFELLCAPRNEEESVNLKYIIQTLRFHAAPELNSNTSGLTYIPPADFDITFFNKGVENTNVLRINTCVLERVEIDYSPGGGIYSTFTNGHPVAVRISLGFRELEPLHKQRILQGF